MKLRYVFPLMLAAAAVGGAATYLASEFNRDFAAYADRGLQMQKKEKPQTAAESHTTFEQHYRHIADALGYVCSFEVRDGYLGPPVFDGWIREVEKGWANETIQLQGNSEVRRSGPRLVIETKARPIEMLDVGYLCGSLDVALHRYKGKLPKSGWHQVEIRFYEGATAAILVSPEMGDLITTFGFVEESPDGLRVAAHFSEQAEGGGFEILRLVGGKFISEFTPGDSMSSRDPAFKNRYVVEVIGWIDSETLLLLLDNNQQAKLIRRDGKWQLEYLSP